MALAKNTMPIRTQSPSPLGPLSLPTHSSSLCRDSLTYAAFSIRCPLIPRSADAYVHANEVLAFHLFFSTVMFPLFTLILIWKECATTNL